MKYTAILDGLEDEALLKFLEFLNANPEGNLTVYLSSNGGNIDVMQVMLSLINEHKDRITLVCAGQILSSAFTLFFSAKCKREIVKGSWGLYHLVGNSNQRITSAGVPDAPVSRFQMKDTMSRYSDEIAWCKALGMNKKELKLIKDSDNACFTDERLREFLEGQEPCF